MAIPPFRTLIKSRDVEDPVNLLVHRPLAYLFARAVYPTSMTPNMVTFLAMIVGVAAAAMLVWGTPGAMVAGGILLWTSAILDGADGILARAKNMSSDFGRAIDGLADNVVAFSMVTAAVYHFAVTDSGIAIVVVAIIAIITTLPHLVIYDFYKETYLRMTRVDRGGEGSDLEALEAKYDANRHELSSIARFATGQVLIPFLKSQQRFVQLTNPLAWTTRAQSADDAHTAAVYRKHNWAPMQLWTVISLAPHSYLMAIAMMFDRLDIYLWVRLVGMNAVALIGLHWQRRATIATHHELLNSKPAAISASLS